MFGLCSGILIDKIMRLFFRDLVDLIGDHLELYRRTQASIGVDVLVTLSSEERDEQLKQQLLASNDLHPALVSAETEHKVWMVFYEAICFPNVLHLLLNLLLACPHDTGSSTAHGWITRLSSEAE